MARHTLLVAGLLAVTTGQEQTGASFDSYKKFLVPPRGTYSRPTKINGIGSSGSSAETDVGALYSTGVVPEDPLKAKLRLQAEDLKRKERIIENTAAQTTVFVTKTKTSTGILGLFWGALSMISVLAVRVRRGASKICGRGRRSAQTDSAGGVELLNAEGGYGNTSSNIQATDPLRKVREPAIFALSPTGVNEPSVNEEGGYGNTVSDIQATDPLKKEQEPEAAEASQSAIFSIALNAEGGYGNLASDIQATDPLRKVEEPEVAESAAASGSSKKSFLSSLPKIDVILMLYFGFWYLGNYFYNITNKRALNAAGGAAGFPMVISCLQLGVGSLYSLFLWAAPDARKFPKVTPKDIFKLLPVAFCAAGAHAGSVFALSAGAVSFGQIVKAAEPAFAAVIGTLLYGKRISKAKWLCLIPVIGGVCLASLKELDFAVSALVAASIANIFAAFKANENAEVMSTPGLKDRLGSVGNQFAITTILSFLITLPLVFIKGESFSGFFELAKSSPAVLNNLIASGLMFYGYNELATNTIKKTSAVTASVANTAKRVIVIVGSAIVLGESLNPLKLAGCSIGIGGVFLYSIIDNIVGRKKNKPVTA